MIYVNVRLSFALLFNLSSDPTITDANAALGRLSEEQRRYWKYLLELIQNNRWNQYYYDMPGYSLHCIKTRYNQHVDDNSPYRLFFFVEAKSQTLFIVGNLKISSSEHTSQHHLNAVQTIVTKYENQQCSISDVALDKRFMIPLAHTSAKEEHDKHTAHTTSTSTSATSTQSTYNLEQETKQVLTELGKHHYARKNVVALLKCFIYHFNLRAEACISDLLYQQLFVNMMEILTKPSIRYYFSNKSKGCDVSTQLGEATITQALEIIPINKLQWIQNLVTCFKQWRITPEAATFDARLFWEMLGHSFTMAPHFITDCLLALPAAEIPKSRAFINQLFNQCYVAFSEGSLDYQQIQKLLEIIDHNDLLPLLNSDTTGALLDTLLQFLLAQKITSNSLTQTVRATQTSASSTQDVLQLLQHIPVTLNFALADKIFTLLLPRLDHTHWQQLFEYEYDLLDKNLFEHCYRAMMPLGLSERLALIFRWIFPSQVEKLSEYHDLLNSLLNDYENSEAAIQETAQATLQHYAHYLQATCFAAVVKQPEVQAATTSIAKPPTKAKKKPSPSTAATTKTTEADFSRTLQIIQRKNSQQQKIIALVSTLLQSHIEQGELIFHDPSLEKYFVTQFLQLLNLVAQYNLIELAALAGDMALVKVLCRYCKRTDPTLLSQHNPCALLNAARARHVPMMAMLIHTYQYDPNFQGELQHSILCIITSNYEGHKLAGNFLGVLRTLIYAGADVNTPSLEGFTPLYNVVALNYPKPYVELFLQHGADPNYPLYLHYGNRCTAYDFALGRTQRDPEIEALILQYGGVMDAGPTLVVQGGMDRAYREGRRTEVRMVTNITLNRQQKAAQARKTDMQTLLIDHVENKRDLRLLLQASKNNTYAINTNIDGYTLLHAAIDHVDLELARTILVDYKPNLHLQVCEKLDFVKGCLGGYLHYCIFHELTDFVPMLIEHGCPVEDYNKEGLAPMHFAVERGDLSIIERLVAAGANPLITTRDGKPMAKYLREVNNPEMIGLLVRLSKREGTETIIPTLPPGFMLRQCALNGDSLDVVEIFNGADDEFDINEVSQDTLGNTVLHNACRSQSKFWIPCLFTLVQLPGLDPTLKNAAGKTALNLLYERGALPNNHEFYDIHKKVTGLIIKACFDKFKTRPDMKISGIVDNKGNVILKENMQTVQQLASEVGVSHGDLTSFSLLDLSGKATQEKASPTALVEARAAKQRNNSSSTTSTSSNSTSTTSSTSSKNAVTRYTQST